MKSEKITRTSIKQGINTPKGTYILLLKQLSFYKHNQSTSYVQIIKYKMTKQTHIYIALVPSSLTSLGYSTL